MYLSGYISSLSFPFLSCLFLVMPTKEASLLVPSVFVMPVFVKPTSCHADAGGIFSFSRPLPYHACLCHAYFLSCRRRRHLFLSRLSLSCLFLVMPTQEASLFVMPGNEASLLVPPVFVMPVSCHADAGGISSCPVCLCHACFLSCRRRRHLLLFTPSPLSRLSLSCLFLVMPLLVMPTQEASLPARPFLVPSVFVMPVSCHADVGGIFSFSRPLPCHACLCHACFLSCRRRRHPSLSCRGTRHLFLSRLSLSCLFLVMPTQEASHRFKSRLALYHILNRKTFATGTGIDAFCFNRNQSLIRLGK